MKKFSKVHAVAWFFAGCFALGLAGCGGGGVGGGSSTGTANVLLTDSPACGYDHVYVTVDHVEFSQDGNTWTTIAVNNTLG